MDAQKPSALGYLVNQVLSEYESAIAKLAAVNGKSVEDTRAMIQRVASQTHMPRTVVIDILYVAALES